MASKQAESSEIELKTKKRPAILANKLLAVAAVVLVGGIAGAVLGVTLGGSNGSTSPASATVSFTLRAQGDVSDYTPGVTQGLAAAFAQQSGVPPSSCDVHVTAGSVLITVTISTTVTGADAIVASLGSVLSNASSATAFLASAPTGGFAIVVTSIVSPALIRDGDGNVVGDGNSPASTASGDGCGTLCQACNADSACVATLSMAITTGDRSTVERVDADLEGDEDIEVALASRRERRQLSVLEQSVPALETDESRSEPIMSIMSAGRRLQTDPPAADCSLSTLREISLAWRGNISTFVSELYEKKAELSAASVVLLNQYRNRYSSSTEASGASGPAWDAAVSTSANLTFQAAEHESLTQREEVC